MKKHILASCFWILGTAISFAQLANWTDISQTEFPINISGQINGFCRITQMDFHPTNPDRFYAITSEGGLFITNDAGENWSVAAGTEGFTFDCASICVDRTNDQILYLGTGDPNYYSNGSGVYKSTDGGATFTATTLTNCLVIEILQHPTDPNTFVAVTNKGIYRSTNNGTTWTAATATNIPFCDLQQNTAANSLILYAGTNELVPRLYRSTDFGSSWTQITSGLVAPAIDLESGCRIAVTPADPNIVYFSNVGGYGMVFKSTDGGLNFTLKKGEVAPYLTFYDNLVSSSGQGNYNNTLYVDRNDPDKIWLQSQNTWTSNDGGVNWTMLLRWSGVLHTDHHYLIQSPYDATKLYNCNDGGVWLSTDQGNTWTPKSNGLYAYEVAANAGKSSHTDPSLVSIGTQDNGRLYRNQDGWFTTLGGDDYEDRETDYLPNGGYFYNMDHNTRTKFPNAGIGTYGIPTATVQAMAFNRTNVELGFMGNQEVYRTANLSAAPPTWTQISTLNKTIMAMHSCIANADRLYVITSDQKIYVSNNATGASPTFTEYSLPAASNTIASIVAIANNADIVYISINNRVYRSADGGQTWTNITSNLPNVNHRKILAEEYGGTEELVFVATNNAVYYKKTGQNNWTNYSTNLPARRSPTDFSIFDDGTNRARIRYASYGRAVFETGFDNLRVSSADFVADVTSNLCLTNGEVHFTDLSLGGVTAWSWTFNGGTPATSTQQNPVVTYSTPGTYDVTLTITTSGGNFTATKTAYITAGGTVPGDTYTVGPGSDFTTLTAAADYWNNNCISGPVEFQLTAATYTTPAETFPITFNANNPNASLLIKPTGTASITGSSASGLLIINGADNITIDGSTGNTNNTICPAVSASRDLTITNTNSGTSSAVVWIQNNGANGATDNTVKNCNIVGNGNSTTLVALGSGSSTISISSAGRGNHRNAFINNNLQKAQYGIYTGGESVVNKNQGTVINQNLINSVSPNNILRTGILAKFENDIDISGNNIANMNPLNNTSAHGIALTREASTAQNNYQSFSGSEVTGATISYNIIDNVVRGASFGSATGIYIGTVSSTTGNPNLVYNNFITRIGAPTADVGYVVAGIAVGAGNTSETYVYNNTVHLTGTVSNNVQSFGVVIGGNENYSTVYLQNNIISNQLSSTNRNYAIGTQYPAPFPRLFSDYNNWYTSGGHFAVVGGIANSPAGDRTTFAAWKSESGTDNNSKNVLPEFTSSSNPHLNIAGANNIQNLFGFATPLSEITDDIDCEPRHPSNPTIGADENCAGPTTPTLSSSVSSICPGGSATLSIASGNLNSATNWHWYTGSCGGTSVGTGNSITVSPSATTTYYVRGEGSCVTPGSCASITVTVDVAPTFTTCPANQSVNTTTDLCSGTATYTPVTAGTTPVSITYSFSGATTGSGNGTGSGSAFNTGVTTVTLTATNVCGTATCIFTITVTDNQAPAISCPGNASVNTGSGVCTAVYNYVAPTGTDNCPGANTTQTAGLASGSSFPLGSTVNTFQVTAANGQSATCQFTVTVNDAEPPAPVCKNHTVNLDVNGMATIQPSDVYLSGTDNCGSVNLVSVSPNTFGCNTLGAQTVTLTVNDGHGNTATCTATVTVTDNDEFCYNNLPPIAACKNITVAVNASCQASPSANAVDNGSSDLENGPLSFAISPSGPFGLGPVTVTLTVTDDGSLSATCTAVITVADQTAPSVTCKNATAVLNASGQASISTGDVFQSGSDNCGSVNQNSVAPSSFTCANIGANTVTLTVSDGSNNTNTCVATVTVSDQTAPSVTCKNATAVLNASGQASISTGDVFQSGSDNCGPVTQTSVAPSSFTCANIGANTVTLTVSDAGSNTATCTATVTVADQTGPTVVCKNATAVLNASGQATITPNSVYQSGSDNCGPVNLNTVVPSSFTCANIGANTVTLTVSDAGSNTATCTATVTVADQTGPTVVCKNATAVLNASGQATITPNSVYQSGADNCGPVNLNTAVPSSFTCANIGANTVTLTVSDAGSNTATCTATVTVADQTGPTVVCKNATVNLNASGLANITTGDVFQSATDNCGSVNQTSVVPSSFNCTNLGANTVTLTVTDGGGNTSTCTATVTVRDLIVPTMLCKNATIQLGANGQATLTTAQVNNGSFDNCAITVFSLSQSVFTCTNIGNNQVTLFGRDASGNQGQCTATVTVTDPVLPIAKCKSAVLNLGANGIIVVPPSAIDNGSSDNCFFSLSVTPASFSCANIGKQTVTLRATDGGGNTATCTALVTVRDNSAPVANCANPTIFLNLLGQATLNINQVDNGSSDNCGLAGRSLSKTAFNCSEIGAPQPVILTLSDNNGNSSTCISYVTVKDAIAPVANCEDVTVELNANGIATVYGSDLALESTDNCSVWSYSPIAKVYTAANIGQNNLTITVKDWSNNASTCVSVVTVEPHNGFNNQGDRNASTLANDRNILVFPNPTEQDMTLLFDLSYTQPYRVRVMDTTGRLIYEQDAQGQIGENNVLIPLKEYSAGVYFLELHSEEITTVVKMLIKA
ncbi:MAG: HYR domain-containing protein [Chitinophagales bacterium]|nr:HYR domain-containing protein [Chitinophagales bacterium]